MMLVISATMEVLDYYDSAKYCDIVAASGYTKLLAKLTRGILGPRSGQGSVHFRILTIQQQNLNMVAIYFWYLPFQWIAML